MMHSGIWTYSIGMSSSSSAKLFTYLILLLNFELQGVNKNKCIAPRNKYKLFQKYYSLISGSCECFLPDKGSGDGQDSPDKPGRMNNNKRFQVLSKPEKQILKIFCLTKHVHMILCYKSSGTSCRSSGSTSSANRGQESSCEAWPRSGIRSCSPPLPSAPMC